MNPTSQHATADPSHADKLGKYLVVYLVILIIAGLQFVVAYQHIDMSAMLFRMLLLAILEAVLAVVFFMHLGGENRTFVIWVALITLFVFAAMQYGWTDSNRMERLAPPPSAAGAPQ
ncbi:MAG TPA: cytochrome C oxidase subunit IV family protein [Terriglobales bacterium]